MSVRRFRVTTSAVRVPTSGGDRIRAVRGDTIELDDRIDAHRHVIGDLLAMGSVLELEELKPKSESKGGVKTLPPLDLDDGDSDGE